jgi:LPXTG-motif cell wall-anchored protein
MKNLGKIALALGGLSAICAGFAVGTIASTQKAAEPTLAATTDHARIYVYLGNNWTDWSSSDFYIHYWGGTTGSTWASCPKMTKVVSDYYQGLWYYDLPSDTTTVLFKTGTGDVSNANETEDLSISTYQVSQYVFFVKSDTSTNGKRWWDKATTAGMNSGQLAAVLGTIHVCDVDTGYGYNAWPQLNSLFVTPSTGRDDSTSLTNWNSDTTTLGNTINRIQANYTAAHPSPAAVVKTNDDSSYPLVLGGLAAIAVLAAGSYFFIRKKKAE